MANEIANYNIQIAKGDTFVKPFYFPFSLTGSTFYFTIRTEDNTGALLVYETTITDFSTTTLTDDTLVISIPEGITDAFTVGSYYFAIQQKKANNEEKTYIKGKLIIVDHAGKLNL